MSVKDYYRLLGVEREASGEEIKKAYRRLAMECHPDRNQDKPGCEDMLKEINEAYYVLGDKKKRKQYDLIYGLPYGNPSFYEGDLSEELIMALRGYIRGGFPGLRGGCRGGGIGMRGCRRRAWNL